MGSAGALHGGSDAVDTQIEYILHLLTLILVLELVPTLEQFGLDNIQRIGEVIPEVNRLLDHFPVVEDLLLLGDLQYGLTRNLELPAQCIVERLVTATNVER